MNVWDLLAAPAPPKGYDPNLDDFVRAEVDKRVDIDGVTERELYSFRHAILEDAYAHCQHKNRILLRLIASDGRTQYRHFCTDCGDKTNAISFAKLSDKEKREAIQDDGSYHRNWREEEAGTVCRVKYPRSVLAAVIVKRLEELGAYRPYVDYHGYIQSDAWREGARARAMELDGFKCQVCHRHKAEQVHHITYDNVGYEKDGELLAVCRECHQKLTEQIDYLNILAASYRIVREAELYKRAGRKEQHYEVLKQKIQALGLPADDYSRRITELARAIGI